jgi:hypothetical protein
MFGLKDRNMDLIKVIGISNYVFLDITNIKVKLSNVNNKIGIEIYERKY